MKVRLVVYAILRSYNLKDEVHPSSHKENDNGCHNNPERPNPQSMDRHLAKHKNRQDNHQSREDWLYVAKQKDIDGFIGNMQHVPQPSHQANADCKEKQDEF